MSGSIWAEKYRPKTLDEMVNQTEIVSRMKNFVKEKNLPHLLLVGPAGVGKTTSILCLSRDLYGPAWQNYVMEVNASDERGIDVIREKVKNFARTTAISGEVPFKILILDEADSLTSAAQHALRRIMEIYTRTCRFCLIGNYSENIIDPIQSRCSVFRYGPLPEVEMKNYIAVLAEKEHVKLVPEGLDAVYESSAGDLRKAREVLRSLLIDEGLAAEDIIRMIYSELMRMNMPEKWKVRISDAVGEVDFRLTQGARPEIQLSTLLAKLALASEQS
ncbi:MAG: replication factor C small subunit [Candidatus Bathyarchaeota archaeon]|nr:replication factor C small subunit [Candidatus Bathyarchaeota archaeon]